MKRDKITLSINPSYFCNFRCSFCYLSEDELADRKVISNDLLFDRLNTVSTNRLIEHIDLYGGEIALIKPEALMEMISIMRLFFTGKINIITNLSHINPVFLQDDIDLSVSWDYTAREKHETVLDNMFSLNKKFHVLILASSSLVHLSDNELDTMIGILNSIPNLETVEIKPFSNNLHHPQSTVFSDFESFVKRWIQRRNKLKFEFINISKIESSLSKIYRSWSDEHLYITPKGHFAVLEFNELGQEFFLELKNFEAYEEWSRREKIKIETNPFCGNCEFLGTCLSEHLQPVKDLKHSCNGFKYLLQWYEKEYQL